MKVKHRFWQLWIIWAMLICANTSWALMKEMTLSSLVTKAPYICRGQVVELRSDWENERKAQIVTQVKIQVLENLHQKAPETILLSIPGGIVDTIGQINSNSPRFGLNEKVIVFLSSKLRLIGEYQGKFQILGDMAVERGLAVSDFIKEIKGVIANPNSGFFFPRLSEAKSFAYATTKYHWCTDNPMGEYFYINANTPDVTDEESSIMGAALTWNDSGACFHFSYNGKTTKNETAKDGENIICWGHQLSEPVLAQTTFWYSTTNGCMTEIDCEFNDNEMWVTNGQNDYDLQTSMLHEFGHYLCLEHSDDTNAIMYPYYNGIQRFLYADDIEGIKVMYGECENTSGPTWSSTYQLLLGQPEKLALLREYRNVVLSSAPLGKYQVELLYLHSDELLTILRQKPSLLLRARAIIEQHLPEIQKAIDQQKPTLYSAETQKAIDHQKPTLHSAETQKAIDHQKPTLHSAEEISSILKEAASYSSLSTKFWLLNLDHKLNRSKKTGKPFFGFTVEE